MIIIIIHIISLTKRSGDILDMFYLTRKITPGKSTFFKLLTASPRQRALIPKIRGTRQSPVVSLLAVVFPLVIYPRGSRIDTRIEFPSPVRHINLANNKPLERDDDDDDDEGIG